MAHWISSKLKAAETLLQQIDQQAAESLRKNENQTIDDQLVAETSSKAPETRSLIKDQLKKKSTENVVGQSIIPSDKRDLNIISRNNSDVNQNDEATKSLNLNSMSSLSASAGLTDSDWTELLSVPDKRGVYGAGTQSSNRLPTTRALKKNGKKVGSSGQGLNLAVGDKRTEMIGNNVVLKSSSKSNIGLESNNTVQGVAKGANADLTKSLANAQKNLEIEADHIAELRHQIHMKEATYEELRREISNKPKIGDKSRSTKGVEYEIEMLEAEYSFVADKVARMQVQAKTLETSIEATRREIEDPSEVEIELKRRLVQLTDHLIQKQAQVETLSSEKAMLLFRIETLSRMLDEHVPTDCPSSSSRDILEQGTWQLSNTKLKSLLKGRMQSGQQHFGSLVRQLDSLFCTGAMFLRRNSTARTWCVVYLTCLHLWVIYILMSHSPATEDLRSGAVVSLENINNTGNI